MTALTMIALDLVAMAVLVFGLYFPRHRRADLVAAYFGVNIGVLAVAMVLANSTVSAGLGLGLFGVLSIIRLRSSEITQREIAYYFASLSIGLILGMTTTLTPLVLALLALLLLWGFWGRNRLFGAFEEGKLFAVNSCKTIVEILFGNATTKRVEDNLLFVAHHEQLV